MAAPIASARPQISGTRTRRWFASYWNLNLLLGVLSIGTLGLLWEFARPLGLPAISNVPPPSEVVRASARLLASDLYWDGWVLSLSRVTAGFLAAQIVGIPLGLMMAMHRGFFDTTFPVVEILRPIPPYAACASSSQCSAASSERFSSPRPGSLARSGNPASRSGSTRRASG